MSRLTMPAVVSCAKPTLTYCWDGDNLGQPFCRATSQNVPISKMYIHMTQQFQTRYLSHGNNWTNVKRCQYQHSRFTVSLLEEGKIVISGSGHMLIFGPVRMARGTKSSGANFSHSSLLYYQGIEENHHGQLRIRSRREEVPQRKNKGEHCYQKTRDEKTC